MHPFLDTSKLTDDELIERIGKSQTYMHAQMVLGHRQAVDSIREVIGALEDERRLRLAKAAEEANAKKDDTGPIELGKLED